MPSSHLNMRFVILPLLLLGTCYSISGQQIDQEFARDGLFLFKDLEMDSSQLIDYHLTEKGEIYALYESDIKRNLIRLLKNGHKDITFNFTSDILNSEGTTPVAMSATSDGNLVVLSNLWNGFSWMIHINEFNETGALNPDFGRGGIYTKSILDNSDDNFGQYLYTSPRGEIVVIAKINDFSVSTTEEKIAILKLSEEGKTLSSDLYANRCYKLDCSAMQDDYLLLAYSGSTDDEIDRATYLAGLTGDKMESQNLHCLSTDGDYETIDHIQVKNSSVYISQLKISAEALYPVRKYDLNGNPDDSFKDIGRIDGTADLYTTNFVVGAQGEVFVVSKSMDDDFEILIKKLNSDGQVDGTFGTDGFATLTLRYPITELNKLQIDPENLLYIAGDMTIEGNSYGFITRVKTDVLQLKRQKLDKFINTLFVTQD